MGQTGQRDSLVIFGHRRTGKSSIIWNLSHFCALGDDTGLVVLNLQSVDYSQGLSDLCYAIAFELWHALPTPCRNRCLTPTSTILWLHCVVCLPTSTA